MPWDSTLMVSCLLMTQNKLCHSSSLSKLHMLSVDTTSGNKNILET